MTVAALLARCRAAGLLLMVEGEALCVDYEGDLPADLIGELRRLKPEVMAALSPTHATVIAPARWAAAAAGERPEPSFEEPALSGAAW